MELKFKDADFQINSKGAWLMIRLPLEEIKKIVSKIDSERVFSLIIKPYIKKRTKSQNALLWELCGQLATQIRSTPIEVYRTLIREVGNNFEAISLPTEHAKHFIDVWGQNGIGYICDIVGEVQGMTDIICYYGSSSYDRVQMSALIDLLMQECEEFGIDTTNPQFKALVEGDFNA